MERSTDSILEAIESAARKREGWDALTFLEAAQNLVALMGNETDLLIDLNQKVAAKKMRILEAGQSAAYAKICVDASEEYRAYLKQKAKCDRIVETVRIAKKLAALKNDEQRS